MYNIIAIMGKAGSGKDTILQTVLKDEPALHEIISCTSRPMRQGEKHGINYFYYNDQDFLNKIENGEMLESTNFNNWYYGTGLDSVSEDKINIGVFNPAGVRSLLNRKDCNILVFWVQAADKTRLIRQLNRESDPDVKEIIRRFSTDEKDFSGIDFSYISLKNEDYFDDITCAKAILVQAQTYFAQGQK